VQHATKGRGCCGGALACAGTVWLETVLEECRDRCAGLMAALQLLLVSWMHEREREVCNDCPGQG